LKPSLNPWIQRTLLLVVASALVLLLAGRYGSNAPAPAQEALPTDSAGDSDTPTHPPPDSARVRRVERAFLGRGGTLSTTLDGLAVPSDCKQQFLTTAARYVDLRRLQPRSGVAVVRDGAGRVMSLGLRDAPESFLRVRFADDGPVATELITLPERTSIETSSGVVQSSVAQALSDRSDGVQLTAAFADIFQWDVDLLVDPRPGDVVHIVYEVRHLGQLPPDAAHFDGAANESGERIGLGRIVAASYDGTIEHAVAFWVADGNAGGNYYDSSGVPLRKSFLKSPLNYRRISSRFTHARRHPITRKVVPHHGVDFAAASGTPVVSTADGRVSFTGWDGPLGRAVKIRHGSEYVTIYGHLHRIARGIRPGVDVRQNQLIGYVGSTGRATGPHLHYTVVHGRRAINPLTMENPPTEPLDPSLRPWLELAVQRWLPRLMGSRRNNSADSGRRDIPSGGVSPPRSSAATTSSHERYGSSSSRSQARRKARSGAQPAREARTRPRRSMSQLWGSTPSSAKVPVSGPAGCAMG